MTPFAKLASRPCPPLDDVALAVARELTGRVDEVAACRWLDELGLELILLDAGSPAEEAEALGEVLDALRPAPATAPPRRGHFALDAVLAGGAADEALLAIAGVEIARRAGLRFGLAGHGSRLLIGHLDARVPLIVDPVTTARVALAELPGLLHWRCSHQAAFTVLSRAASQLAAAGDLAGALHAADLRLALPVEAGARVALERESRALRARLN